MKKFPKRLKGLRSEKGFSQEEFGKLFSLDKSTISLYESGKREPAYDILEKFAYFFDCSTDYLLGKSDIRNPALPDRDPYAATLEDLEEVIKENNIMFDGMTLSDEDKEDIIEFLKIAIRGVKKKQAEDKKDEKK